MTNTRRFLVASFTIVSALLLVTGIAYACVPFFGDATVDVVPTGSGRQDSQLVSGSGVNHREYCGGVNPTTDARFNGTDTLVVTVAESDGACTTKLTSRNHTVIVNNAMADSLAPYTLSNGSWVGTADTGCFFGGGPAGNVTLDTSFSVDAAGSGQKTYTLTGMNRSDPANLASALCVGHPTQGASTGEGIFVPVRVLSTT